LSWVELGELAQHPPDDAAVLALLGRISTHQQRPQLRPELLNVVAASTPHRFVEKSFKVAGQRLQLQLDVVAPAQGERKDHGVEIAMVARREHVAGEDLRGSPVAHHAAADPLLPVEEGMSAVVAGRAPQVVALVRPRGRLDVVELHFRQGWPP